MFCPAISTGVSSAEDADSGADADSGKAESPALKPALAPALVPAGEIAAARPAESGVSSSCRGEAAGLGWCAGG